VRFLDMLRAEGSKSPDRPRNFAHAG
jgi:hypothetical protein